MITVFTPTYNREKELHALYDSLLSQKYKDFEWLIVDDGSKDNTEAYIESLKKEKKLKIKYIRKENGGKPSAYNVGLENAKGEVFLCVDSDDIISGDALEIINNDFTKKYSDDLIGFAYNRAYITDKKKVIGTRFPDDVKEAYYYDIYSKLNVKGDKLMTFKTSIAREYLFPIIDGEKFVPEALVYNRLAKKYKFGLSNKIIGYSEYLPGGYSANYFSLVKRNPKGNALYFKEKYDIEPTLYNVYGYILFSMFAKENYKKIVNSHPSKLKVRLLYLPVWFIYLIRR